MAPVVSSSTYWIPPSAREGSPQELPDQTRNYLDPWDLENYAYLRRQTRTSLPGQPPSSHPLAPAQVNPRRRSVAFDEAVHYASYSDDGYGPLSLDEGQLQDYEEHPYHHCPYHHYHYTEYGEGGAEEEEERRLYEGLVEAISRSRRKLSPLSARQFALSTLGHLRIDYSTNWSNLDRFIAHRGWSKIFGPHHNHAILLQGQH